MTRTSSLKLAWAGLLGALVLAVSLPSGGCSRNDRGPAPGSSTELDVNAQKPIDRKLMLVLASARAYHHQADVYIADGDTAKAIESVRKITELPFPGGAPEGQEALDDAYARLSKLELMSGRVDEALAIAKQRLAEPAAESFFRSNLLSVTGELLHERAKLVDATDKEGAKAIRREAIQILQRAIDMNERLIDTIVEEAP